MSAPPPLPEQVAGATAPNVLIIAISKWWGSDRVRCASSACCRCWGMTKVLELEADSPRFPRADFQRLAPMRPDFCRTHPFARRRHAPRSDRPGTPL